MTSTLELYRRIAEQQASRPVYEYEVGTHRFTANGKTYYRIQVNEYKYIRNLLQYRKCIHAHDYQLSEVYSTRTKLVARAKLDAGLWRVKTKVYAY